MEATVLSWRFQNILSIMVIIVGLGIILALGGQAYQMTQQNGS